jgi:hypothetical protein
MLLCAAAIALNHWKRKTKAMSALSTKIVHEEEVYLLSKR